MAIFITNSVFRDMMKTPNLSVDQFSFNGVAQFYEPQNWTVQAAFYGPSSNLDFGYLGTSSFVIL